MLLPQQGFLQKPALNSWSPGSCVADLSDSEVVTVTYASERNQGTLYLSLCLKSLQFAPNKTSQMVRSSGKDCLAMAMCVYVFVGWAGQGRHVQRSPRWEAARSGKDRTAPPGTSLGSVGGRGSGAGARDVRIRTPVQVWQKWQSK